MDRLLYNIHRRINKNFLKGAFLILISWLMVISIPAIAVSGDPKLMDAWSYAGNGLNEPGNLSWIQATSVQKSAVIFIDSNRWETRLTTGHDQFDYQMYRFYIAEPSAEITNLTSTWIGYGENKTDYNTSLYIWDVSDNSWEQLDSKSLITDGTLNGSITTNITNYVDIDGYVYIAAAAKHNDYPPVWVSHSVSAGILYASATDLDGNHLIEYNYSIDGGGNSGWTSATSWNSGQGAPATPGCGEMNYYYYHVQARENGIMTSNDAVIEGTYGGDCYPDSCPFVYIWNGTGYEYVTDLGGLGLGSARAITGTNYDLNYVIPDIEMIGGKYNIRIRENLAESDFFDYLKLMIADVPQGYSVYNTFQSKRADGWQWHIDSASGIKYNSIENDLITFNNATTRTPITAYNKTGVNVADRLANIDKYPVEEAGQQKQEYTLDFGNIEHPEYAKILIWSWTYFNTTKQNVPMTLYVINSTGMWEQVADLGVPTGDLHSYAYNISNIWKTGDKRIKLIPMYKPATMNIIDKIALDDSAPITIEKTVLNVTSAVLQHSEGVNEYNYPTTRDRFSVGNLIPDKKNYYQFGNYTKYGEVSSLLSAIDDKFVVVRHGDELLVSFEDVATQNNNINRVFILDSLVYYVMVGSSIGHIDTINLLPFRNMSKYPYNTSIENYPGDEEHNQYLQEWNSRICTDRLNGTCYDSTTGDPIITGLKNVEKTLPRSLNTNYVELKSTFKPGYNVSGYVTDITSGLPISGALVRTNYSLSATTDASGFYNITLLNSTYIINASIIGYDINSTQITVNGEDLTNANISLVYHPYDVSGYIIDKSSGLPLKDVEVKAANTNFNITTDPDGFYRFKLIDGEHSIIAILPGYAINSTTITINSANITDANIFLNNTVPQGRDAWDYAGYDLPVPYSNLWMQATTNEKNAISYNDQARWETKHTTNHDQFDFQIYRFKASQPINEVNNISMKWIGHGENRSGYDTYLYIWNIKNVSWDLLASKNLGVDGILNKSITSDVINYIDINGLIFLGAAAKHYDYVPGTPSWISLEGTYDGEPITCSWGPVIDPDGDLVQYFANINGYNSGWINDTSFTSTAIYEWNTCSVKTRDNFTYTESSSISTDTYIDYYYSLNTNYVELELGYNKGYNVSGYITDVSSGLPVSGVLVRTNTGLNMTTNSSGYYNFTLLNSTYIINASIMGYDNNSATITVNGIDLTNVNISLLYKLRDLSGYIKDSSTGLPLNGVLVRTNTSQNTTTNSNGFYNFKVFDGTYIINASVIGYDPNAITVNVKGITNNANISLLYHPYNLSGYIRDASNGLPLGGVVVKVADTLFNMTTGSDGFYGFSLIDGEHSIIATLPTYAINSTTVTISGADIAEANILLMRTLPQGRDSWNFAGKGIPVPYSASWISATTAQKSDISYDDSRRWETKLTNGHDQFDVQMYRFHVSQSAPEITNITSTWIGYGENHTGYDTYLYIWNYNHVSWEQIDKKHLTTDGTLNGSITTNPIDYIDLYGFVYIAAAAKHNDYPPVMNSMSLSGGIITASASDPDGDTIEYYYRNNNGNSGWITATSWNGGTPGCDAAWTYFVKARANGIETTEVNVGTIWGEACPGASCPFVNVWNGSEFEYVNDVYGTAIGVDALKIKGKTDGYYDLGNLVPRDGKYILKIRESIAETDFFDYAKLLVVDVPQGHTAVSTWYSMSMGNGWFISDGVKYEYASKPGFDTVIDPVSPISVIDKYGQDMTAQLSEIDDVGGYETAEDTNYFIIDFGKIEHPQRAKLLISMWQAVTSESVRDTPSTFMSLDVINESGGWEQVAHLGGSMGDTKTVLFNISNIWITNDTRIRLHPKYTPALVSVIDKIALDDSESVKVEVTALDVEKSKLNHSGADDVQYSNLDNSILVNNKAFNDKPNNYFYGNFTKYGSVTPLLDAMDDKYVIMRHGDELELQFPEVKEQEGKHRQLFLNAFVWYSVMYHSTYFNANKKVRDVVEPLPFLGMSEYPYDTSIENYPFNGEHNQYLSEWNTRVCDDRVNGTCYNSTTSEQIVSELETYNKFLSSYSINNENQSTESKEVLEKPLQRSLNTNFVELKVNSQLIGNSIFNLSSATTLSSSYITWDNDIFSDNRVYYGLNETDVSNLVNGSWSDWNNNSMNPAIRLAGLLANTTYYYRPFTWYLGNVNNSVKAARLSIATPGVWITPAESMVSPAGWRDSPKNFRTINISAAPRDSNGRYIPGLSLEAVVYSNSGVEINRTNLIGTGPYYANIILPDYYSDERGYVTITNYSMAGEFNVLKWSCANCHADGERYPSNFNSAAVHLKHTDTQTSGDCDSCHNMGHASPDTEMYGCYNDCHNYGEITCNECHNDIQNSADVNTSVLSNRYGKDVHLNKKSCTQCHGGLASINPTPSCASTSCHPKTGSNLTTVPGSIRMMSHSNTQTVACSLCHNSEHDIRSLTMDAAQCKTCHTGITHNNGAQCTVCHGSDPHNITLVGGADCLGCHNSSGVALHRIDGSAINMSIHRNLNPAIPADPNSKCWGCHDSNGSKPQDGMGDRYNTPYKCIDCHTSPGIKAGGYGAFIVDEHYPSGKDIKLLKGNDSLDACILCHNKTGMKVNYTSPDNLYTNYSVVSHYGKNRNDLHNINETNCSYCHQNASEFNDIFQKISSTQVTHNNGKSCLLCHRSPGLTDGRIHDISLLGGGGNDCVSCHITDVNISKFARHANVNTSDGPGNVTNNDCWTCHYQKDMDRSHVYLCESCHSNGSGIVEVNDSSLIKGDFMHGMTTCKGCHAPYGYHQKGTVGPLGHVENILRKMP